MRNQIVLLGSLILVIYPRATILLTFSLLLLQLSLHDHCLNSGRDSSVVAAPLSQWWQGMRTWNSKLALLISSSATLLLGINIGLWSLRRTLGWISRMKKQDGDGVSWMWGLGFGGLSGWDWRVQIVVLGIGMAVVFVEMRGNVETVAIQDEDKSIYGLVGDTQKIKNETLQVSSTSFTISTTIDDHLLCTPPPPAYYSHTSSPTGSPATSTSGSPSPSCTTPNSGADLVHHDLDRSSSPSRSQTRKVKYGCLNERLISGGGTRSPGKGRGKKN